MYIVSFSKSIFACEIQCCTLQIKHITLLYAVADLEIFRGGFSFTKTPAKLEVKTKKKKGLHQLFESSFSSSSKFTL